MAGNNHPKDPHSTSITPRESSKGTFFPVADFSNWRVKCKEVNNLKLDDEAKRRYLEKLSETGKRGIAAAAAGVDCSTIQKHMSVDPEFMQAAEAAWDHYREQRVLNIENEALNGFEETIFSPTGEMATRRRYETQLRVMMLKAYDPDRYADKQSIDVNFKGGAVVIPLTPSNEEWEKQFANHSDNYVLPEVSDITTAGRTISDEIISGNINKNTDLSKV